MQGGFFTTDFGILILTLLKSLALIVPLLIGVAYLTYAERKVLAAVQLRRGPRDGAQARNDALRCWRVRRRFR